MPNQQLRTGTDNAPFQVPTLQGAVAGPGAAMGIQAEVPRAAPSAAADYTGLSVPSVWRTNRSQAAAKVDALASGGMDDFEIPAFLRKQAD